MQERVERERAEEVAYPGAGEEVRNVKIREDKEQELRREHDEHCGVDGFHLYALFKLCAEGV